MGISIFKLKDPQSTIFDMRVAKEVSQCFQKTLNEAFLAHPSETSESVVQSWVLAMMSFQISFKINKILRALPIGEAHI